MHKHSNLKLHGTQTAENLAKAFAGESQARTRYLFYSEVARDAGYATLEQVFLETADDERGHAEMFFEYLCDGLGEAMLSPRALVPVAMGDTSQNLIFSAGTEFEEWSNLYPSFASIARQEGFDEIATSFISIAEIEKRHDARFRNLHKRLKTNMLYSSPVEVVWECINCGYRSKHLSALEICPACHHPKQFARIFCDNPLI